MRILLVDDHPLFLDGLRQLLTASGFDVAGTARDGLEAIEAARTQRPDLILMDIAMPHLDGLAATRRIVAELPDTKIVMLTMSTDDEDLFEAVRSGACGYLLKSQEPAELLAFLADAARGELVLAPGLAARIVREFAREAGADPGSESEQDFSRLESLTPRQAEVLALVARGTTYREVARQLHLSERTIKYHMGKIVQILQLENRDQAVRCARGSGWLGR